MKLLDIGALFSMIAVYFGLRTLLKKDLYMKEHKEQSDFISCMLTAALLIGLLTLIFTAKDVFV